MAEIFDLGLFKRHPYAIGGTVIIGGVLVWYFFLRAPSGSTAMVAGPVDNPQLDLAYAQLNAQGQQQGAQIAGQLAMAQLAAQTQITLQTQALQVKAVEDSYSFQLGQIAQQNNLTLSAAQIAAQSDAVDKQFQLQAQQIQSQQLIAQTQLATQMQEQQNAANAQIAALKITTQGAIAQSTINANLQQNLSTINAQLQNNITQAQSQNYQKMLETQAVINGQNVSERKHESNNNFWGGVIGAVVGAFL